MHIGNEAKNQRLTTHISAITPEAHLHTGVNSLGPTKKTPSLKEQKPFTNVHV